MPRHSVPDYDRVFLSYDARCPVTLKGIADKIRELHFAINAVEEQYEKALVKATSLDTGILPIAVADNFKVLHERTETVLHQLADFFKIPIDGALGLGPSPDVKHRYHEAVIKAFQMKHNPLTPILGCRDVQDILFAWKKWRNKWATRKPHEKIASIDEGNMAFIKVPHLIRRLREAVSEANSMARHGVQVCRGERGDNQIEEVNGIGKGREQRERPCGKEEPSGFFQQQKAADEAKSKRERRVRENARRGQRSYGRQNIAIRGGSRSNAAPLFANETPAASTDGPEKGARDDPGFAGGLHATMRGVDPLRRNSGSVRGN